MDQIENKQENNKKAMTAFEILKEIMILHNSNKLKEADDFIKSAKEAGFDFSKVNEWQGRNPEFSLGQVLKHAEIDPDQVFMV